MGSVSVTFSYSFRCLTTETVKYINETCFIDNLAASIQYVGTERQTHVIINMSSLYAIDYGFNNNKHTFAYSIHICAC